MPNKINAPRNPKIHLYFKVSFDNSALAIRPNPRNIKGSFKIPDVQNNKLGNNNNKRNSNLLFISVRSLSAINNCFNPSVEMKHMINM